MALTAMNRTVEQMLRNYVNDLQDDWDEHHASIQFTINNTEQASTKATPFQLVYGRQAVTPAALLSVTDTPLPAVNSFLNTRAADIKAAQEHLRKAQERQATHADKKRRDTECNVGDNIKLSTENTPVNIGPAYKLIARFAGPFKIIKKLSRTAYEIELPKDWNIHNVFHISRIYPLPNR